MSQLVRSADDIFKMPMENLNISRDWSILYRGIENSTLKSFRSTESCHSPLKAMSPTSINKIDLCEFFYPTEHSTPNNKLNARSNETESSSSSVDAMSFSTKCPNPSTSRGNQIEQSLSTHQYDEAPQTTLPTISNMLDYTQTYVSSEVYGSRERQRRITKKGIKGFHRIVGFAISEDGIKKKKKIQACSVTLLLLAIVVLSVILVHIIGNNFSNKNKSSVPSFNIVPVLIDEAKKTTVNATNVINETNTEPIRDSYYLENDTDKTMMNDKMLSILNVILKIRDNLKTFPRYAKNLNASAKATSESEDELVHVCQTCHIGLEVCMLDEERGTPVCRRVVDEEDPTGCGGLCALETEACRVVERTRGVRSCRPVRAACGARLMRCASGACVPRGRRCPRPERFSECDLSLNFHCGDEESSCLPLAKRCDGIVDCLDAHDELNCTRACPHGSSPCNTGGACVANERFCDGRADCADRSDEPAGCSACTPSELRCINGRCVRRELACDGRDDCGDATDEINCPKHFTTRHVDPQVMTSTADTRESKSSTPFVIHKLLMLNVKRSRNSAMSITATPRKRVATSLPTVDTTPPIINRDKD